MSVENNKPVNSKRVFGMFLSSSTCTPLHTHYTNAERSGNRYWQSLTDLGEQLLEELEHGKNTIIDITESRGLAFLGMVEPTRPIDHNIGLILVQPGSAP